jgi:endonuclease YncB( thermonuclease family)
MPTTMTRLGGILIGGALLATVAGQAHATTSQQPTQTTTPPAATSQPWQAKPERLVVRVVDGDTIDVAVGGRTERVRLLGIDAPETGTCYAQAATWHVNHLLIGKRVRLESDRSQGNRDRYARLLRYVRMPSTGTNLNKYLVREGYAREYTYNQPYRYQAAFRADERTARNARRGLWGACPTKPAKPAPPVVASWVDRDCGDFATQRQAQAYFTARGGSRTRNVDGLDGDADGIACEALP